MTRAILELFAGVILALPLGAMISTYDQWFPIVRGWIQ